MNLHTAAACNLLLAGAIRQQGASGMDTTEWSAHIGKGKRAVVTGGAGFLGSHLCANLLHHGFSVTAIDNLSTGNRRNLATLHDRGNFTFLKHDVVQPFS